MADQCTNTHKHAATQGINEQSLQSLDSLLHTGKSTSVCAVSFAIIVVKSNITALCWSRTRHVNCAGRQSYLGYVYSGLCYACARLPLYLISAALLVW